jgi:hypothetical protein
MTLKEQYNRFREWQQRPYQVRPLVDEEHDCATCGTHYSGNYCPRCGQSSTVGRYSFKNAFLLFLDVWGLGNRGMFRSLRDLLLRPGYMIRDYLGGMQMAYFPPFKMFFLLIAFSVLVDSGFNIKGENRMVKAQEQIGQGISITAHDDDGKPLDKTELKKQASDDEKEMYQLAMGGKKAMKWVSDHQTIVLLLWLLVFSGPLYLFFRRSPKIPDIRYSEFFVAMVYTNNMMIIYSIVCGLLCLSAAAEIAVYLLSIVPLKQLSGYSYKRTLGNVLMAGALLMLSIVLVSALATFLISLLS